MDSLLYKLMKNKECLRVNNHTIQTVFTFLNNTKRNILFHFPTIIFCKRGNQDKRQKRNISYLRMTGFSIILIHRDLRRRTLEKCLRDYSQSDFHCKNTCNILSSSRIRSRLLIFIICYSMPMLV